MITRIANSYYDVTYGDWIPFDWTTFENFTFKFLVDVCFYFFQNQKDWTFENSVLNNERQLLVNSEI